MAQLYPHNIFSFFFWWRIPPNNGSQILTLTSFAWTVSMLWIIRHLADCGGAMTVCSWVSHILGVGICSNLQVGAAVKGEKGDHLCCFWPCPIICHCCNKDEFRFWQIQPVACTLNGFYASFEIIAWKHLCPDILQQTFLHFALDSWTYYSLNLKWKTIPILLFFFLF